jgi:hypothetical protein
LVGFATSVPLAETLQKQVAEEGSSGSGSADDAAVFKTAGESCEALVGLVTDSLIAKTVTRASTASAATMVVFLKASLLCEPASLSELRSVTIKFLFFIISSDDFEVAPFFGAFGSAYQ